MNLSELPIDLSTFRSPVVEWRYGMFAEQDAMHPSYNVEIRKTTEGVFFTGTLFEWMMGGAIGTLKEYKEGKQHGRSLFFFNNTKDTSKVDLLHEETFEEGEFIALISSILPIDISTFRRPIVIWKRNMFVADDSIYTNYMGYLQTSEGVFFTGTVFDWTKNNSIGTLVEYKDGIEIGKSIVFAKRGSDIYVARAS